jgi:hypothetical protein
MLCASLPYHVRDSGLLKYKDMLAKRWSLCGFVFHPSQSESLKRSGKIVTDKALLAASKQTVFLGVRASMLGTKPLSPTTNSCVMLTSLTSPTYSPDLLYSRYLVYSLLVSNPGDSELLRSCNHGRRFSPIKDRGFQSRRKEDDR